LVIVLPTSTQSGETDGILYSRNCLSTHSRCNPKKISQKKDFVLHEEIAQGLLKNPKSRRMVEAVYRNKKADAAKSKKWFYGSRYWWASKMVAWFSANFIRGIKIEGKIYRYSWRFARKKIDRKYAYKPK